MPAQQSHIARNALLLKEYFADLYSEIAFDNTLQIARKLEKLAAEHGGLSFMEQAIKLLVDEIGHLKTDLGQLRLEVLSRGIPDGGLAVVETEEGTASVIRNPPQCLELNMASAFSGLNWHQPEIDRIINSVFRWTGPGQIATVALALDRSRPLVLEMVVANGLTPAVLSGLTVHVDGAWTPHALAEEASLGKVVLSALLPPRLQGNDVTTLSLVHAEPLPFPGIVDPASTDHRAIGIPVYRFRIFPYGNPPQPETRR